MKTTAYLRVAKMPNGRHKIVANTRPQHAPVNDTHGYPYPTVAFAVKLEIPDAAFRQAERVIAEINIPDDAWEVAAEVVQ